MIFQTFNLHTHTARCGHAGIGSTVIDEIEIGEGAVIGAGAVVIRDVPDHAVAVGVPARGVKLRP